MNFTEFSLKMGFFGDILLLIFGFGWMFWPGFAYYLYQRYYPDTSRALMIPFI